MSAEVDTGVAALFAGLEVSVEPHVLDAYSHDCWPLQTKLAMVGRHELRPDAVVFARTTLDVVEVVKAAASSGIPVTTRGLGSSVTGQPLPQHGGVVLDVSGLTGPAEISAADLKVTVGAGWRGGDLEEALREQGLTLGNSPQSLHRSTVGGWVATGESGQLSSRYGGIEDLLLGVEVVLADGSVCTLGSVPRSAMGPALTGLFVGSEGTLGVVTRVTFRVSRLPETSHREAFAFAELAVALDFIREIAQSETRPALVRLYDEDEARHVLGALDHRGAVAFIETQGPEPIANATHAWYADLARSRGALSMGPGPVDAWAGRRFDFSAVEKLLASPGGYAETIEVAHTWSRIGDLYSALKSDLTPLADHVYGHFSHVYGQGTSLYMILLGSAADDEAAVQALTEIWRVAMDTSIRHGAVLSHHHGAGLARLPHIPEALGTGHDLLARVKGALDPQRTLNPGKLAI